MQTTTATIAANLSAAGPAIALRRPIAFFRQRAFGWTALALLLGVWELAAAISPSPGLPAPSRIATVWLQEMRHGDLPANLLDTLTSMAWGYGIAAVIGLVLGVLMARVRVVYALMEPLVELMRPIPTIIFIPVIILYLGLGREMNVFAIVLSAVEPILIASYSGARAVSPALRDTAASFGLNGWQTLRESSCRPPRRRYSSACGWRWRARWCWPSHRE